MFVWNFSMRKLIILYVYGIVRDETASFVCFQDFRERLKNSGKENLII